MTEQDLKILKAFQQLRAINGPDYFELIREESHAVLVANKDRVIELAEIAFNKRPNYKNLNRPIAVILEPYWLNNGFASIEECKALILAHHLLEGWI